MRVALVMLVAALVLGWAQPVVAFAQDAVVEIEQADEPLVVGATGVQVMVLNTTTAPVPVTVSVTARTRDGDQARLAVTPSRASIAPAGELAVRVTRTSYTDLTEPATGWLVVVAGETVTRRPVRVALPSGTPGTTEWHVDWTPWPGTRSQPLPGALPVIEGGCAGVDVPHADRPVLTSGGDTGRLVLGCRGRAVVLTAEDFPRWGYGDYTGEVVVGDTAVDVTVRRRAPVWIAGGLMLAGLLVALAVQGWVGDRRVLRSRRSRLAALEKDASKWDGLALPMKDSVTVLAARLESLACKGPRGWLPWPEGHNAKEFAEFDAEVDRLTALVAAWPGLVKAKESIEIPEDRSWAPGLYASLEQVKDCPADSTDGLSKQAAELDAAADALAVVTVAQKTDERITAAEQNGDPVYQPLARRARLRHNALRSQLLRVTASTEVATLAPTVAAVVEVVDQLPHRTTVVPPGVAGAVLVRDAQVPAVNVLLARLYKWGQNIVGATLSRGTDLVVRDVWVAVLLTFAGVWSGLALLYLDKPWGGPNDMIAAAVWGFATPTLVAPVLGAVRRIGSRVGSQPAGGGAGVSHAGRSSFDVRGRGDGTGDDPGADR